MIFPTQKSFFFPGSPPSSSRHRKRRNPSKSQQSPLSNFRKRISPTQKSLFARTPQKKKSHQIPAIASLQLQKNDFPDPKIIFFPGSLPSSSRHRKRRNPSKSQQSPLSNFRKMISPTQKSFFSGQSAK